MLLCTVQLWEKITEKQLHGITGIQKSQNIFMLGSSTNPMCSIHWLGEIGGGKKGKQLENRVCKEDLKWRDVLANPPGGSR